MNTDIQFPQGPITGPDGYVSLEWREWLQNPQVLTILLAVALDVTSGGTGLTSGVSGGILGFTTTTTMASSTLLTDHAIVLGGGAGDTPSTPITLGTSTTLLHGNASGDPTWAQVNLTSEVTGVLPVTNGGTGNASNTAHAVLLGNGSSALTSVSVGASNTFLSGVTGANPVFRAPVLASADFANQGTTSTVLHGNAAGNPSFGAVSLTADVTGILPLANGGTNANLTASNGGILYSTGSAAAILSGTATAGQILRSGASAAPAWSTATYPATAGTAANVLRSDGTNFLSAALAAADLSNGTTGSGSVVLAGSPTLTTPILGVASATSINFGGGALSAYVPLAAFTPVLSFGGGSTGITYATQSAVIERIGSTVHFELEISLSNKGSSTGAVAISGFTIAARGSAPARTFLVQSDNLTYAGKTTIAYMAAGATSLLIFADNSGAGATQLSDTAFANNTTIRISGVYFA